MARAGQLKGKIDLLRKKMAEKGTSLGPERQRQLRKRLKRLQRSRRVAAAAESRTSKKPAQETPAGAETGTAPA
ncbi:MAG TPA: hypothetical protein VFB95_03360 [Candidatus Cryosericum sp.]|nr:hypothetical protein [Candidatus Cryosericum sp.]